MKYVIVLQKQFDRKAHTKAVDISNCIIIQVGRSQNTLTYVSRVTDDGWILKLIRKDSTG